MQLLYLNEIDTFVLLLRNQTELTCEEEGRLILGFTFPWLFSQLLPMYPNQQCSFFGKKTFEKKPLVALVLRAS